MIVKIRNDVKEAMKEKNIVKRDVLKMVINKANAIAKNAKIDIPTDEMVIDAIKKEKKQLQDTMDILKTNGREDSDLYVESQTKMTILNSYLPKQLDFATLKKEIENFISINEIDISNKSSLMKAIMPVFKNKADGKLINEAVNEVLNK